jgi:predicted DNA binding CopG/RHH family protein
VINVVINEKYLTEVTEKRKAETVKVNSKEKKQIMAKASKLGLGFSTYMRSLALTDSEEFAVEDK